MNLPTPLLQALIDLEKHYHYLELASAQQENEMP